VTRIIGSTITGEHLQIDETNFIGCTLVRCVLGYDGGGIPFDSTIIRNCSCVFRSSGANGQITSGGWPVALYRA